VGFFDRFCVTIDDQDERSTSAPRFCTCHGVGRPWWMPLHHGPHTAEPAVGTQTNYKSDRWPLTSHPVLVVPAKRA
jgi:hypothetical protein